VNDNGVITTQGTPKMWKQFHNTPLVISKSVFKKTPISSYFFQNLELKIRRDKFVTKYKKICCSGQDTLAW
jgi:hypothetical protein